ncbi:alkyl hydroperoxide reductase/ Thiol specific antioxidant/ Mal allergen, partial [mine drainage metagenome]
MVNMNMKIKIAVALVGVIVISIVIIAILNGNSNGKESTIHNITVGSSAPNYGFFLDNGTSTNLTAFKGHTTLIWFVATWCPSCAQGNAAINQNYQFFKQHG